MKANILFYISFTFFNRLDNVDEAAGLFFVTWITDIVNF